MPEHPWRCSQCGTINEPVANSCRTCGKWPSLFDLEDNFVEDEEYEPIEGTASPAPAPAPAPVQTYDAPEPETFEVETFEPEPAERPRRRFEPPPTDPVLGEGEGQRGSRWITWLVPIAFVVYFVLSYAFSGR
jgi:hypothetical protein